MCACTITLIHPLTIIFDNLRKSSLQEPERKNSVEFSTHINKDSSMNGYDNEAYTTLGCKQDNSLMNNNEETVKYMPQLNSTLSTKL